MLADIRRADVRAYIQHRKLQGVKESTVKRELRFACAAVNFYCLELELEARNPFQSLGLSDSEPRTRWLTREEAVRLVQAASLHARTPHLPCFIRLALNTGCRRGELLGLEWSRVDMDRQLFRLDAIHTKTARRRSVPLNREAMAALLELQEWRDRYYPTSPWVFQSWTSHGPIRWLKTGFRNACERAGIDDFRIHDLRHTCASWLVMAGVDLYVVRDLLGHASITQTERYAHLAPAKVAAAVALLEL